jgi:hypothetical protein
MSYEPKPINLISPTDEIPESINAIESFDKDWLKLHAFNGELTLYHYTTEIGLLGILESQSIWCSHIQYFNDPAEWVYGEKLVVNKINDILLHNNDSNIKVVLEDLITYITSLSRRFFDVYAACFCIDGNLLSQWRGYSNRGGGYSLGFTFDTNTKFTYDLINLSNLKLAGLRKVIYNKSLQEELIDKVLSYLIDSAKTVIKKELNNKKDKVYRGILTQMAMNFSNRLAEIIVCFKNQVFEKEDEWRLIIFKPRATARDNQREVRFRPINGILTPFLSTNIYSDDKIKTFPLNSIIIGPGLDYEIILHSINLLIEKQYKAPTEIKIRENIEVLPAGYKIR